jgi:hypothetical protein
MASPPGTVYGHPTCGGAQAKRLARRWRPPHGFVRLRRVAGLPSEDRYVRRLARITGRDCGDYGRAVVHRAGQASPSTSRRAAEGRPISPAPAAPRRPPAKKLAHYARLV